MEAVAVAQSDLIDPAAVALESRKLVSVPAFQEAIDRPVKIHIDEILTAWREADRALGMITEGSPEWARVHAKLVSLRASYHQLFAERCDRPPRPEAARLVDVDHDAGVGREDGR
jgi:hypothetical protein